MWVIWTVGYKENVDPNPSSHSRSSQTPGLPWFTQGRRHGLGRTAIILWDTLLPISYCSYCVDVQSLPLALSHLFKGKETLLLLTFVTMSSTVLDKLVRILTRDSFMIWPLPQFPVPFFIMLSYPHWAPARLSYLQCLRYSDFSHV